MAYVSHTLITVFKVNHSPHYFKINIAGQHPLQALRGHGLQRQGGAHLLREGHQGLHLQRRLRLLQAEGKDGQPVVIGGWNCYQLVVHAFPVYI